MRNWAIVFVQERTCNVNKDFLGGRVFLGSDASVPVLGGDGNDTSLQR